MACVLTDQLPACHVTSSFGDICVTSPSEERTT